MKTNEPTNDETRRREINDLQRQITENVEHAEEMRAMAKSATDPRDARAADIRANMDDQDARECRAKLAALLGRKV